MRAVVALALLLVAHQAQGQETKKPFAKGLKVGDVVQFRVGTDFQVVKIVNRQVFVAQVVTKDGFPKGERFALVGFETEKVRKGGRYCVASAQFEVARLEQFDGAEIPVLVFKEGKFPQLVERK